MLLQNQAFTSMIDNESRKMEAYRTSSKTEERDLYNGDIAEDIERGRQILANTPMARA